MIDSKITWIDAKTALPDTFDNKGRRDWLLAVWRHEKGGYGPVLICSRDGTEPNAPWLTMHGTIKATDPAYWARLPTTDGLP